MAHANGVLEAPAKTEANPKADNIENEAGRIMASALPKVAPIKTSGMNSPPLKPDPTVKDV